MIGMREDARKAMFVDVTDVEFTARRIAGNSCFVCLLTGFQEPRDFHLPKSM